jgi:glycolate oxidase iron-sulfur subunit
MKKKIRQAFTETINREFQKCAACGECRMVCPVYGVEGFERSVARGRLALAKALADGDLELTDRVQASFDNCLLCMACVENCAGHVDMIEVVLKSRAYVADLRGVPRAKTLAFKALGTDRKYQDLGAAGARAAQALAMAAVPENSGLRLRLARLNYPTLPPLARRPFIARQDRIYGADKRQKVMLFVGCAGNYIYDSIPRKTVAVLNALDVGVIVLSHQGCCGAPVLAHADSTNLERLAVNNVQVLSDPQFLDLPIVTICSSGGLMLKHHYPGILSHTPLETAAKALSCRTMDISQYLADQIGIDRFKSRIKQKIPHILTYHDPCHLGRGQGVAAQPRILLKAVCDHFSEMPDAAMCCGLGGTYGLSHTDVSRQILKKKTDGLAAMDPVPSRVATGCPACIMQLSHGLARTISGTAVNHTVHYLWQALTGSDPGQP